MMLNIFVIVIESGACCDC